MIERTTRRPEPGGEPIAVDGVRRLALVVGIGKYRSPKLPDLKGPVRDARAVYQLLSSPRGYGFPPENIRLLLDEEATVRGFREAFDNALIKRARPGDIALFYYAGHGSQAADENGDEPDGWDETLVLHDSRTGGVSDLVDDELNAMLARLHAKTRNITVVLDSCNSGSATRDGYSAVPRLVPPASDVRSGDKGTECQTRVTAVDWVPESLPGLVVLSAAKDGTPALEPENGGHGFFTSAFLEVLSEVSERPLTWAQVSRRMPRIVAHLSRGRQAPTFQGQLDRYVFECRERRRPMGWEVVEIGEVVELRGTPLPGWGPGAEVRIYPGNAEGGEIRDPAKSKGSLRIVGVDGFSATAERLGEPRAEIEVGDLGILLLPGVDTLKLPVRLLSTGKDSLGEQQAAELRRALDASPALAGLVEPTENRDSFTVGRDRDGSLWLRGPEGVVRNRLVGSTEAQPRLLVESLARHARQIALLTLQGETGAQLENGSTLAVRILPLAREEAKDGGAWRQAEANAEQIIPVGTRWRIEVTNTHDEIILLVGGAVLWNDGGTDGVPFAGDEVRLGPGESTILDPGRPFEATPPLGAMEHVVLFGTQEDNPINWSVLTDPATSAERGGPGSPLQRLLAGYLAGTRGGRRAAPVSPTWTSSYLPFRVVDPSRQE